MKIDPSYAVRVVDHALPEGITRVPQPYDSVDTMNTSDRIAYELHKHVCEQFYGDPDGLRKNALGVLAHWEAKVGVQAGNSAWRRVLSLPATQMFATILETSDQGQWLRSCSPLGTTIDQKKRLEIIGEIQGVVFRFPDEIISRSRSL